MDANTYYLNQHLAEVDADDALQEWRDRQAADIATDIMNGDSEQFWDLGSETATEMAAVWESDDQQDLIQLIIAASRSGDPLLESCARRYYAVIESEVDRMADAKAADMLPEDDDDY